MKKNIIEGDIVTRQGTVLTDKDQHYHKQMRRHNDPM